MQYHYPLRFFSGLGFRLGLGLGLLLGSAGLALATSLQLFMATYDGSAVRVDWEVSTETDITGFDLSRKTPDEVDFRLLKRITPTGQLRYIFADTCLYQSHSGLLQGPVVYLLTVRGPGPDQAYTTTVAGTVSTIERSWGTIKSMFR